MRSPSTFVAVQLAAALLLSSCLVTVTEKQCDTTSDCGSGWICVSGVCHAPDGGGTSGGGSGNDAGPGGGTGGGGGGSSVGGGVGGGGGNTCAGCRDSSMVCQPGTTPTQCGAGGLSCKVCLASQTCINGACINACTASSCPSGCCQNGACVLPMAQSVSACGISGMTCAACGTGLGCFGGKCVPTSACSAMSCPGCCSGNICLPFNIQTLLSCGAGGSACKACTQNQICSNGNCTAPPTCTAATCPLGCCNAGQCVGFASQNVLSCGKGGAQCNSCPGTTSCTMGTCTAPTCGPNTCSGCCTPTGCQPGNNTMACGKSGSVCSACMPGQSCVSGGCVTPTKKIGDACALDSECALAGPGAYCKQTTSTGNGVYTGGFCTRPCANMDGGTCTADSVCLSALQPYGENDVFCSPRCSTTAQCRPSGYACYFINTVSTTACWLNPIPVAAQDGGVDAGLPSFIGTACVNSGQCTNPPNSFCIQDVLPGLGASGFVGGYCSSLCSGSPCVAGSSCQSVTGFSSGITQQVCLRDCTAPRTGQSNCRNGYVCEGTIGSTAGACLPRCNNSGASCPSGTTCNTMTGYCN